MKADNTVAMTILSQLAFEVTFTEFKDVYAENLVEIFENETGLVMGGIK